MARRRTSIRKAIFLRPLAREVRRRLQLTMRSTLWGLKDHYVSIIRIGGKVDKTEFQWPHGITPPFKNVRKRRFRKTLAKRVCPPEPRPSSCAQRVMLHSAVVSCAVGFMAWYWRLHPS